MALDRDKHRLFLKLLLEHQAKVHAYILSLVPNYADADDVLQEVSQLLWQRFDEFQPDTNFLSWALRFAYFEAINFRKWHAKSKEMVFDDKTLAQILPVLEDEMKHIDERLNALEHCLGKLEERSREIIKMRYNMDLRPKEISVRLGYTIANVYKRLSRIHSWLRNCAERRMHAHGVLYE